MSDARNPGVDRVTSGSTKRAGGGMGGVMIVVLGLATVGCAAGWLMAHSAKTELKTALDKAKSDNEATQAQLTSKTQESDRFRAQLNAMSSDMQRLYIPLSALPSTLQAPTRDEVLTKIRTLAEGGAQAQGGGTSGGGKPVGPGPQPVPAGSDPAKAALEAVAAVVVKGSINTKLPTNNEPGKVAVHRNIQTVFAKLGVFTKPVSGDPKDTYEATIAFQKANGLTADGIIGRGTWGKVREKLEGQR